MASPEPPEPDKPISPPKQNGHKSYLVLVIAAVLIVGGYFGFNAWKFNSTHVSTDDAQITSDVVPVSPQVSANVVNVLVVENQEVKAGDLIVSLDASSLQAAYNQAKANLDAAVSAANEAGVAVQLAGQTGAAQEQTASGILSQADTGISQAKAETQRSKGAIDSAVAVQESARANIALARSALAAAEANLQKARDSASAAQAQVATAQAGLGAAKAGVDSAQTAYYRAQQDAARYATLYNEGAVSAQTSDNATAAAKQAKAQLDSANQQVAQAESTISQQQSNLKAANRQVEANAAAVAGARSQIDSSTAQATNAAGAVKQAQAQYKFAAEGIGQAQGKREQALGGLNQARTAPVQVAETRSASTQAKAKIAQAKAALQTAAIQLADARIYAPVSGRISRKTVEVGQYVQPGSPLLTIIPDKDVWVVANYKETQLADVKQGNKAEIEVDGLPGKVFNGHVDSISAGTGATFALLPPDNATGNFTKVVQRIAVKILIDSDQPDYDRLRAGMSVVSTISTQ